LRRRKNGMASIWKRKNKDGTITYYICYYHNGKLIRERIGNLKDGITERMARQAARMREADIYRNRFNIEDVRKYPSFEKILQAWGSF